MILGLMMIITLVVGILLVVGTYFYKEKHDSWNDVSDYWSGLIGYIALILGSIELLCTLIIVLCNKSYAMTVSLRNTYTQNVTSLNATYESLQNKDESYDLYSAIMSYNDSVSKFKTEIITQKEYLRNPWINWYCNSIYNTFDENAVSYFTI